LTAVTEPAFNPHEFETTVEKLLGRLGFKVTPLAEPAVVNHGNMAFRTVRFLEKGKS
jgi:hypothetical protein